MAAPDRMNWINQAIAEVAAVLRTSTVFMSPVSFPEATGLVKRVDTNVPDPTAIRKDWLPHAGVVYLGHDLSDGDTSGTTSYAINVGIQLTHRGADREALWEDLQKIASRIQAIVSGENLGGNFNGFSELASALGGTPIEDQDERTFTAIIQTGIKLDVTLED